MACTLVPLHRVLPLVAIFMYVRLVKEAEANLHLVRGGRERVLGGRKREILGSLGIPHWVPCSKSRGPPPDRIRLPSCAVCGQCFESLRVTLLSLVSCRSSTAPSLPPHDISTKSGCESRNLCSGPPPESEQAPLPRHPCYIVLLLASCWPPCTAVWIREAEGELRGSAQRRLTCHCRRLDAAASASSPWRCGCPCCASPSSVLGRFYPYSSTSE